MSTNDYGMAALGPILMLLMGVGGVLLILYLLFFFLPSFIFLLLSPSTSWLDYLPYIPFLLCLGYGINFELTIRFGRLRNTSYYSGDAPIRLAYYSSLGVVGYLVARFGLFLVGRLFS